MDESNESTLTRREMIAGTTAALALSSVTGAQATTNTPHTVPLSKAKGLFTVNGQTQALDARTTLVDALREHLQFTGTKKGCDHRQCGAYSNIAEAMSEVAPKTA